MVARALLFLWVLAAIACGPPPALLSAWKGSASDLRFTPDGRHAVARTGTGVAIYDASTGAVAGISTNERHIRIIAEPMGMDVSPDGKRAAYISNGALILARIPSGTKEREASSRCKGAAVAFTPDGERLVVYGNELEVYSARDLEIEKRVQDGPFRIVEAVAVSPDGQTLASAGSWGSQIDLWSTRTWALRDSLIGDQPYVSSLSFSRDGSRIASLWGARTIIVWDPRTRLRLWKREVPRHILGLAISPDGRWLATGAARGHVIVLDARSGRIAREWLAHDKNGVRALAFSPDGHRLVTSGFSEGIRLWDFDRLVAPAKD